MMAMGTQSNARDSLKKLVTRYNYVLDISCLGFKHMARPIDSWAQDQLMH
jgi:hypothetical protein